MMDLEKNNLIREELLKLHHRRKVVIITNIILIAVLLFIGWYVISNVELIKFANQDWCKLCEFKTGAKCFKISIP